MESREEALAEAAPARPVIVIADDVAANRRLMAAVFGANAFDPIVVDSGVAALEAVRTRRPDVILVDLQMPGMDGIETLAELRLLAPTVPVLILTAFGDISVAVEAIRLGADDFLTRPISNDALVRAVRRAIARGPRPPGGLEPERLGEGESLGAVMGPSEAVAALARQVRQVASTDVTVLVTGETGVGKDVIARALHDDGRRRPQPMVMVDCGAIPDHLLESELFGYECGAFSGAERRKEGRFELAGEGTIFLDEIGNMSPFTQAKLLRVLQDRCVYHLGGTRPTPITCRVVAATNEHLMARVERGAFRADLYYRLAEYVVNVPSLRERMEDLPHLVARFARQASAEFRLTVPTFTPSSMAMLHAYRWPGNVRELRNLVRQAVLRGEAVIDAPEVAILLRHASAAAVTPPAPAPRPMGSGVLPIAGTSLREVARRAVTEAERAAILDALRKCRGNKTHAARLLQVDYKTLHTKMKRLQLTAVELEQDGADDDGPADGPA
ncbi:MAG: sigma-54 dependent transcriptional regulator [Kofleriaceae bacterium]